LGGDESHSAPESAGDEADSADRHAAARHETGEAPAGGPELVPDGAAHRRLVALLVRDLDPVDEHAFGGAFARRRAVRVVVGDRHREIAVAVLRVGPRRDVHADRLHKHAAHFKIDRDVDAALRDLEALKERDALVFRGKVRGGAFVNERRGSGNGIRAAAARAHPRATEDAVRRAELREHLHFAVVALDAHLLGDAVLLEGHREREAALAVERRRGIAGEVGAVAFEGFHEFEAFLGGREVGGLNRAAHDLGRPRSALAVRATDPRGDARAVRAGGAHLDFDLPARLRDAHRLGDVVLLEGNREAVGRARARARRPDGDRRRSVGGAGVHVGGRRRRNVRLLELAKERLATLRSGEVRAGREICEFVQVCDVVA